MVKNFIKKRLPDWLTRSLENAAKDQNLNGLIDQLKKIVPDISDQYTTFKVDSRYLETKVRNMHAFQVSLILPVLDEFRNPVVVDIGDSSGAHIKYLKGLYTNKGNLRCLSVNLDKTAVEKIQSKGIEAVYARAEDLGQYNIRTDIFISFETLEHIMDPCNFLHALSAKTQAKYFILTVPYVQKSRVGLRHIRMNIQENYSAENTHIFELSPADWKLLFTLSGWKVEYEQIYYQYPRLLHGGLKYYWKKYDFEGFYGVRLVKDHQWSDRYLDWPTATTGSAEYSRT